MAKVLLLSSASTTNTERDYAFDEVGRMRASAAHDKFGVHSLTDDAQSADLILFVENCDTFRHYFHEVRQHPHYADHPDKCFLHTRTDFPVPFLPGVYASLRHRWYNPYRVRTGGYLRAFNHDFIHYDDGNTARDYLYSFMGKSNTHPVRDRILQLYHDRQYLQDTTPLWPYGELDESREQQLKSQYTDVSLRSKFILAPRGRGTSSIRLFESLRMGRPPVIIADQWVAPEGPDWSSCSIRVKEREVDQIPEILEAHENQAEEMGQKARQVWEDWFARESIFHRTVEWCLDIQSQRPVSEMLHRFSVVRQLVHPRYLKSLIRTVLSH
jgi:hypothetical protein